MRINRTAILLLSLPLLACTSTSDTAHILQQNPSITMSSQDLRGRVRSLARPLAGIIERSADWVIKGTDDPNIRLKALIVKTEAIPALFEALFRKDPGVALIDASAFIEQFRQDIVESNNNLLNDEQKAILDDASDEMKQRLQAVFLRAGASQSDVDEFWVDIEGWARRHPIDGNFAVRDSTSSLLKSWGTVSKANLGSAISSTQAELADFAARADIYAEHLPRQSRWQAQILVEEMMAKGIITDAIDQAGTFPVSIEGLPIDIEAFSEGLIDDLLSEMPQVGQWIDDERDVSFGFLTSERRAILSQITAERIAILEAVAAERIAILSTVESERELIVEVLKAERKASFVDLEAIVSSALVSARRELIDHIFIRALQLLALILPIVFIGALFLIWFAGKNRRS